MDSTVDARSRRTFGIGYGGRAFREWVTLTCDGDRFDIDCDPRVSCQYAAADFMAVVRGDAVVVEPAAFRFASQMVAHAVVEPGVRRGRIQIVVRRQSIRCAEPYLFAYVDGRHCDVMGTSGAFTFVHRDGLCDCSGDTQTEPPWATVPDRPRRPAMTATSTLIVPSLLAPDAKSEPLRCSVCQVLSNYQQVLEHLAGNVDRLTNDRVNIDGQYVNFWTCRQTERLNNCMLLMEYQCIKTNMMNAEIQRCHRFIDGLMSSLLKNHKAIFRICKKIIFVNLVENQNTAEERFMESIIISQKQKIVNLTNMFKELSIVMNTMQLFAKV